MTITVDLTDVELERLEAAVTDWWHWSLVNQETRYAQPAMDALNKIKEARDK